MVMYSSQHPIVKLAAGIIAAEGWDAKERPVADSPGTRSYRDHNPGNLKASPFNIDGDAGFCVFENDIVGYAALLHLIANYAEGKVLDFGNGIEMTEMLIHYTGLDGASPEYVAYAQKVQSVSGLDLTQNVASLII